jgi:hypothetical protein
MRSLEERLSELLRDSAPMLQGVDFEALALAARRRRRRALSVTGVAFVGVVLAAAVVGNVLLVGGRGGGAADPPPAKGRTLSYQGITFTLPAHWVVGLPQCGPVADRTVVVGTWQGHCPFYPHHTPTPTGVRLTPLYGPQFALLWQGRRTSWHGQPAWIRELTEGRVTTVALMLPWANAVVTAQSEDAATARSLVDLAEAKPTDGLEVPGEATSVFVQSLAGRDGDGQQRNRSVTAPGDVRELLADLRELTPVTSPARACDGQWWPRTALLTVHSGAGERTFAARFDACGLVVSGTGTAARTSAALLGDVRRLLPNSGL